MKKKYTISFDFFPGDGPVSTIEDFFGIEIDADATSSALQQLVDSLELDEDWLMSADYKRVVEHLLDRGVSGSCIVYVIAVISFYAGRQFGYADGYEEAFQQLGLEDNLDVV